MSAGFLRGIVLGALIVLAGCGSVDTTPVNKVTSQSHTPSPDYIPDFGDDGSTIVALAFSGGGMRAAAWAYGTLLELDAMVVDTVPYKRTLVDNIRTVAGTSGGSVMAAYLGYKGKDGYEDFSSRFLYEDAEAYMATDFLPGTLLTAAVSGGANGQGTFSRWLDEKLFEGATFAALRKPNRPIVWLTASDIYNNTPFLFTNDTFAALCSDINELKIADAVGASAAFPGVFAPVVLQTPKADCDYREPDWIGQALTAQNPSIRLQAYARALQSYQSNTSLSYVRVLDGGLTDNLGVTGFALERAKAKTPHGPLSPRQAVRLSNFLFIVTDAGVQKQYEWGLSPVATRLDKVMIAASDTTISTATRSSFDAVDLALNQWQTALIDYRCSLSRAEVLKLRGTLKLWNCRDVTITTEHISFREASPELLGRLNAVPTRLKLARTDVDIIVTAARDALRRNDNIRKIVYETLKRAPL